MLRLFFVLFCIAGVFSDVQAGWRDWLPGARKSTLLLTDDVEMDTVSFVSIPCTTATDVSTAETCLDDHQVVGAPETNRLLGGAGEEAVFVSKVCSRNARAEISGVRGSCVKFWRAHKGRVLVGSVVVGTVTAGAIALIWQASAGDQSDDSPFNNMNATEAPNTTWTMAHEFTTAQPDECTEEFIDQFLPKVPFSCNSYWLTPREVSQLFFEKTYCGTYHMLKKLGEAYYFAEDVIRGVCRQSRACVSKTKILHISSECARKIWEEVQEIVCPGQVINEAPDKVHWVRHTLKGVDQSSTSLLHSFRKVLSHTHCNYTQSV